MTQLILPYVQLVFFLHSSVQEFVFLCKPLKMSPILADIFVFSAFGEDFH